MRAQPRLVSIAKESVLFSTLVSQTLAIANSFYDCLLPMSMPIYRDENILFDITSAFFIVPFLLHI